MRYSESLIRNDSSQNGDSFRLQFTPRPRVDWYQDQAQDLGAGGDNFKGQLNYKTFIIVVKRFLGELWSERAA
jgi:hypothetical protein